MPTKTKTFDMKTAVAEAQAKSKEAYAKGSEMLHEGSDIAKANVDAVVASGKIVAEGVKSFGMAGIEDGRQVLDTLADDFKAAIAVKSPSELFLLQGKLAARNYDAAVAYATKSTSALKDFATKAFAPLSDRAKANFEAVKKAA